MTPDEGAEASWALVYETCGLTIGDNIFEDGTDSHRYGGDRDSMRFAVTNTEHIPVP